MYVQGNSDGRSRNQCCRGKKVSIPYSECVSITLVILHAMRMRCIILSSVACLALPQFSTLPHTLHDFRFSLELFSETFLTPRRYEQDINVYWSSCKVPVILVRLQLNVNFYNRFSKNTQIPNFIKVRPVGAEFLRADGQTDMLKANSPFPQFCERAEKRSTFKVYYSPTNARVIAPIQSTPEQCHIHTPRRTLQIYAATSTLI